MSRNDAFDPIPPPPPAPTVNKEPNVVFVSEWADWIPQPSDPLADLNALLKSEADRKPQPTIVTRGQYDALVRIEVGFAWARAERSWLGALWAWVRNEP